MQPPGLADAYFKTERAKHHLDELKIEVSEFAKTQSYEMSYREDMEQGLYLVDIRFKEPHVWLHLIAGDIFSCLRSALDHAVYSLAKKVYPYPDWTQFPIFQDDNANTKRRFDDFTRGVDVRAVQFIKSLQPYARADGMALPEHMLWLLNKMCNIDKHRRIPVHGSVTEVSLALPPESVSIVPRGDHYVITMPLSQKPKLLQPGVSVNVTFGDSAEGVQIGVDGIEAIYNFVSGHVLPQLAGFCY